MGDKHNDICLILNGTRGKKCNQMPGDIFTAPNKDSVFINARSSHVGDKSDNILANEDTLPGKYGENLQQNISSF